MKSNTAGAMLLALLLGVPALIVAVVLFQQARPLPFSLHQQVVENINQLSQLDVRWNEDVLKTRLYVGGYLNSSGQSYTAVNEAIEQQTIYTQRLEQGLKRFARLSPALLDNLQGYQNQARQKAALSKQFLDQQRSLQAALRQAATATTTLLDAIADARSRANANQPLLKVIERHAQAVISHFVSYMSYSSRLTESNNDRYLEAKAAEQTLGAFSERLQQSPWRDALIAADGDAVALAVEQMASILRQQPAVDGLLNDIINVPTAVSLSRVSSAYDAVYQRLKQHNQRFRGWLIAYLGLLSGVLLFVLLRWRNRRRLKRLERLNKDLEQRVSDRTEKLSQAYEELKQSQTQLVQSEKMSALGQLVAGVAHEINTPLAYSRSNVELVKDRLPEISELVEAAAKQAELLPADVDTAALPEALTGLVAQARIVAELAQPLVEDELQEELEELLNASASGLDQIAEMVRSLKDFSRIDRKKVERFDLNQGLDSALLIAKNKLKHKVEVVKNYGDIPSVTCAPSQINQVFLNMLVNAAQAINDHGTITLTTVANGDHVDVIIEDTGSGIPDDVLPHIFDPFYSTKEIGEGTGLGLSICYQIIEQHGGTISVDSRAGEGTRFIISLFVAEDDAKLSRKLGFERAA